MCVNYLFKNTTLSHVNEVCHFQCIKAPVNSNTLPRVIETDHREYVITNPTNRTVVVYATKAKPSIQINPNGHEIGATIVKIPCDASLVEAYENKNVTIIDTLTPCFYEIAGNPLSIHRLMPSQWTKIPPEESEHGIHTTHTYDTKYPIFNDDWKLTTPTIRIKTTAEYEEEMKNITLQFTRQRLFSTALYGDILYLALFVIVFFLLFILYYILLTRGTAATIPIPHIQPISINPNL